MGVVKSPETKVADRADQGDLVVAAEPARYGYRVADNSVDSLALTAVIVSFPPNRGVFGPPPTSPET